jgi:hypothetical protein
MHPVGSEPPTRFNIYRTMADRAWLKLSTLYFRSNLLIKACRLAQFRLPFTLFGLLAVEGHCPSDHIVCGAMSGSGPFSYGLEISRNLNPLTGAGAIIDE